MFQIFQRYRLLSLSEIYTALHNMPSNDKLPNEAAVSKLHKLPLYATSFFVCFQNCWTGFIIKTIHRFWRLIYPSDQTALMKKTLDLIINTWFPEDVQEAYLARITRIVHSIRVIGNNKKIDQQVFEQQKARLNSYVLKENPNTNLTTRVNEIFESVTKPLDGYQIKNLQNKVIWLRSVSDPFWTLFLRKRVVNQKDDDAIIREPLVESGIVGTNSVLWDHDVYTALEKDALKGQMESVMQQEVPINLIARLSELNDFNPSEYSQLKDWIEGLNKQDISISDFIKIITEVIEIIDIEGYHSVTLPDLLHWLSQNGCKIMEKDDRVQVRLMKSLKPGDTIECNGKALELGEEIKSASNGKNRTFALKDYPNFVVSVPSNRFVTLLEEKNADSHFGFRLVNNIQNIETEDMPSVSGMDSLGRCVVQEKLSPFFVQGGWTSTNDRLTPKDEKRALALANHIYFMMQMKKVPRQFSLDDLGWSSDVLKSVRFLEKDDHLNYNDLEEFVIKASQGNPFVHDFIRHVSTLNQHKISEHYRQVLVDTLLNPKSDLSLWNLPSEFKLDIYESHLKALCKQAEELKERCCDTLFAYYEELESDKKNDKQKSGRSLSFRQQEMNHSYLDQHESKMRQIISEHLAETYSNQSATGRFMPGFEEQFIKKFKATYPSIEKLLRENKSRPVPDLTEKNRYYKEQFEKMMHFNRISSEK